MRPFKTVLVSLCVCSLGAARAHADTHVRAASPNGAALIDVTVGKTLSYAVTFRGKAIVLPSNIEVELEGAAPLGPRLKVIKQTRAAIDQTWTAIAGKQRNVRNHANEVTLSLEESAAPHRRLDLVLHAADEGVAFRYGIPAQPGLDQFRLVAERDQIRFKADHTAWAANYRKPTTSQEQAFRRTSVDQLSPKGLFGLPVLVRIDDQSWVAVTESDLLDWAGMYVRGSGDEHTLVTALAPLPEKTDHPVVVIGKDRRLSPWRVFLLGDRAGALVESDLVRNLATPSQIADTSWIKPGRAAWDRWWSDDYDPSARFKMGMNTATMKSFVDLAADMGWEYQIVDWLWYGKVERPDADLTKVAPEVDIPGLVQYAKSKNVKIWLWARWNHMDAQMEKALPLFESWGVAGIKVDFMDRDDQVMVNFYSRLAKLAAEHHLMVDLHGAYKPTGLERTWPNVLTREGVLGNEYNKWSARVTPTHKVTLPFTRMLAGPLDFTPGGFRNVVPGDFAPHNHAPTVMGTRAAELALTVVYESGLLVLCDSPYEYRRAKGKGLEFLQKVPAAWDETRVLDGQPGDFITIARRSGDTWFIAGLTGDAERTTRVPLAFLGKGSYNAHVWADGADADAHAESITESDRAVRAQDTLTVDLAPAGGFTAVVSPTK